MQNYFNLIYFSAHSTETLAYQRHYSLKPSVRNRIHVGNRMMLPQANIAESANTSIIDICAITSYLSKKVVNINLKE